VIGQRDWLLKYNVDTIARHGGSLRQFLLDIELGCRLVPRPARKFEAGSTVRPITRTTYCASL
jgi:hypothetical protein